MSGEEAHAYRVCVQAGQALRTATAEDRQRATVYRTLGTARRLIDSGDRGRSLMASRDCSKPRRAPEPPATRICFALPSPNCSCWTPGRPLGGLGLPSIEGSVTVYFSPGHEERARAIEIYEHIVTCASDEECQRQRSASTRLPLQNEHHGECRVRGHHQRQHVNALPGSSSHSARSYRIVAGRVEAARSR